VTILVIPAGLRASIKMLKSIRSSVEIELTFMVTRTYVSSMRQLSLVGLRWRYHGAPAKLQHFPTFRYLEGNDPDTSLQNREYGADLAEIKYLNSFRDPGR
jgi:hypothetical protein